MRTPAPEVDFYLSERLLTAEEIDVRDRVRAWAQARLRPGAAEAWDRETFRVDLLPELADLGIVGGRTGHPSCPHLSAVAYGLATQELARADSSFVTFFGVHSGLVMGAIAACGSDEQRARWLPALAKCEAIGAFALTEPEFGSDAAHLATTARLEGDQYILNGAKRWIGNGMHCDVAVVWARADDGIAGFLVEPPRAGFTASKIEGKLSKRGVWNAAITLTECAVPVSARMPTGGFRSVAEILSKTRHNVAWAALGEAIACYEIALAYTQEREQFGKPVAAFQLVQAKLVQMLAEITKAQLLAVQLGRLIDEGAETPGMTALAKLNNAAMARDVARLARELLGGNGILHEHEVMRHLVDLESVYTFEGTNEINTLIVGREITGLAAFS